MHFLSSSIVPIVIIVSIESITSTVSIVSIVLIVLNIVKMSKVLIIFIEFSIGLIYFNALVISLVDGIIFVSVFPLLVC